MTRSNLYQRLFAGLWLLTCVGLAVAGWRYQAPFSYEPVGPRAYPLLCLALMGAGLAWLIARPTPIRHAEDEQPLGGAVLLKVLACIALLLVFAGLFETLGFHPQRRPGRLLHGHSLRRPANPCGGHREPARDRPLLAVRPRPGRPAAAGRSRLPAAVRTS